MLLLVRTVVTAPASGWTSRGTVGGFIGSAALIGAFIAIDPKSPHPLVRIGILWSSPLVRANLAAMASSGWPSLQTAFAFLLAVSFGFLTAGYALLLRLGESASHLVADNEQGLAVGSCRAPEHRGGQRVARTPHPEPGTGRELVPHHEHGGRGPAGYGQRLGAGCRSQPGIEVRVFPADNGTGGVGDVSACGDPNRVARLEGRGRSVAASNGSALTQPVHRPNGRVTVSRRVAALAAESTACAHGMAAMR